MLFSVFFFFSILRYTKYTINTIAMLSTAYHTIPYLVHLVVDTVGRETVRRRAHRLLPHLALRRRGKAERIETGLNRTEQNGTRRDKKTRRERGRGVVWIEALGKASTTLP